LGLKSKILNMDIDIIEKGVNENNEKKYYLMVDFEDGRDLMVTKLTETELKLYAKKIYSKINNLLEN